MKNVITEYVSNITRQLINEFLEGANFSTEVAEKIHNTFDYADTTGYYEDLASIKQLLTTSSHWCTDGVFVITAHRELTVKETAVSVRYINMVHTGGKNIIVINGKIVYAGAVYAQHKVADIEACVDDLIRDHEATPRRNALKDKLLAPFKRSREIVETYMAAGKYL